MEANLHPNQQKIDVHEPEKDEITAHDFKKLRAMKKTKDGKVHNCATHVEHALLGAGTTISEQHAEPDEEGNIAWYTVQFDSGIKKVDTKDLTITMSEAHMHESEQVDEEEKKKPVSPFDYKNYKSQIPTKPGETAGFDSKKISTGTVYTRKPVKEAMSDQAKTTMKHIPNASPALKKAAKDIKPGIAGIRDRFDMLKAGGVKGGPGNQAEETYQTAKSEFVARQGRLTAAAAETEKDPARLKRMSNIPGYSAAMDLAKKTTLGAKHTKEEVEQEEYTFADYLEAARAQYVDEDAVLVANEAFKNKDITLFSDQSQSPEA
jgi:hypothetical protein